MSDDVKKAELLDKYNLFAERMQQRSQRDVHAYLPKCSENKKRNFEQAFGRQQPSPTEKRFKLSPGTTRVNECEKAVKEYISGVALVKECIPTYVEILPEDSTLKELLAKPESWIGRTRALKAQPTKVAAKLEEIAEQSEGCNTTNQLNQKSSFVHESGFSLSKEKMPSDQVEEESFETAKN